MGNLMYAIPDEKHAFCRNRDTKRLYIRQGPKGKQKFVSWGLTCLGCGVIVQEQFLPEKLTEQRIEATEKYHEEYFFTHLLPEQEN